MPIEIKELVIRAVVSDQAAGAQASDGTDGSAPPSGLSAVEAEDIVQACVREVLRVLRQNRER